MGTAQGSYKAILLALRNWYEPTWKGLDLFARMRSPVYFGFHADLPVIEGRLAIDEMLTYYIGELGRLRPEMADLLIRRFKNKEPTQQIAYKLHVSEDHLNRLQHEAINYLSALIAHEDRRTERVRT